MFVLIQKQSEEEWVSSSVSLFVFSAKATDDKMKKWVLLLRGLLLCAFKFEKYFELKTNQNLEESAFVHLFDAKTLDDWVKEKFVCLFVGFFLCLHDTNSGVDYGLEGCLQEMIVISFVYIFVC